MVGQLATIYRISLRARYVLHLTSAGAVAACGTVAPASDSSPRECCGRTETPRCPPRARPDAQGTTSTNAARPRERPRCPIRRAWVLLTFHHCLFARCCRSHVLLLHAYPLAPGQTAEPRDIDGVAPEPVLCSRRGRRRRASPTMPASGRVTVLGPHPRSTARASVRGTSRRAGP